MKYGDFFSESALPNSEIPIPQMRILYSIVDLISLIGDILFSVSCLIGELEGGGLVAVAEI